MYSSILQKIPLAIAGMMLAVAAIRIYWRSRNITRSDFLKILKATKYVKAWILIFVFVITGFFSVFNHMKCKQFAMAVMALNYSEASQAQNSNGTRYNMAEITCDEVVEKAIKMGAFEDVTVKQLKECLSVYPYIQGDVDDKSNYHISTEFVVEYHASRHTQHLNAENVILLLTSAYKDYYIEKYTDTFSQTREEEKPDFATMEYMDIVAYFNKEITVVLNYLYGMAEKGPSFVTSSNTTFQSIAGKVHQFRETQIEENLKSLIVQHGVVRDKSGYIDRLSCKNKNVEYDKKKNEVSYEICNEAIKMYSEEMTRIVLVPTWDESGKYYMGRTRVGIDELSVMATNYSDNVAVNKKELMENQLVLDKMKMSYNNRSAKAEADALIESISNSIDIFTKEAIQAGREYADYAMNQCIAVSVSGISLFNEVKSIMVYAVFAYLSAVMHSISKKFPAPQ